MSNLCVGVRAASATAMPMTGALASSPKHARVSPKPLIRDASASTNDRSRRASWRRRSDFRFGLADSESGSAATRPVSATKQNCLKLSVRTSTFDAFLWTHPQVRCRGRGVPERFAMLFPKDA